MKELFETYKCCVLIPTYNNDKTLAQVIKGCLEYSNDVIVVNDGCTDTTAEIINSFGDRINSVAHKVNKGKGIALQTGFKFAHELGYKYAITIDSDGQHMPHDLPKFIDVLKDNPRAIVIGARNMDQESVPGKSSFGHKFSNFWFHFETGIKAPDTQSGYRLYPLDDVLGIKPFSSKYEYEIEVMVRASWRGVDILSVPIEVYYATGDERVSHFRPFQDFTRVSILNTVLVTFALLWIKPRDWFRKIRRDGIKELFGSSKPTSHLAASIGFGAFMGVLPIWGFQMLAALPLSRVFKLNTPLVILSSNVSFYPMVPIILYVSFVLGRIFVADPININFSNDISLETIGKGSVQYVLGSITFAVSLGIILFFLSFVLLKIFRRKNA